jgi:hypothetical protein
MMRDLRCSQMGLSAKYAADCLDEKSPHREEEGPPADSHAEGEGEGGTFVPPDGYRLVPEGEWSGGIARIGEMARDIRRLRRYARRNRTDIQRLNDSVEALTQLLLEGPLRPPHRLGHGPVPLIVVAGLPERERGEVLRGVGDGAEVIFFDTRGGPPEEVGDCDHLIVLRHAGPEWCRRASELHEGRTVTVRNARDAAREAARLAGV